MSYEQIHLGRSDGDTAKRYREAKQVVAEELDEGVEDLTEKAVVRELVEAYLGGDALGRWRHA
jgi:hypothetical protein